ncbi:MAG TPA: mechanosensitive ion channel family protein [Candidatus Angelobacter sp.]|nr:mechanosensitive ion channel family protein [Candidatus Angelobacter sp.]
MNPNIQNLWQDWRQDLNWWLRHGAPKLISSLILAVIFIWLLRIITRKLIEFSEKSSAKGTMRAQQVRTIAGMVQSVGIFAVLFLTGLQILPLFGIDIGPLLASAGIVGVAVGFGAQTVVKDLINGFFIVVESQFEVGDTVRIAGVKGVVEEITMRRTILRDDDGTVHIVPNSDIRLVSNLTRDWSKIALQISVDYREDTDRVIQLLREVSHQFSQDPAYQTDMLGEPEVPGIDKVTGYQVDYLVLIKARPGKQYGIARELRRQIKACLDKNNIQAGVPLPPAPIQS